MKKFLSKFFGDKAFYRQILVIMLPITVQNAITNFVNMLDNVMVGRTGTFEMSGVSVANQLIFVFNICIFGVISGAGIFGAQFFGSGDHKGVRDTLRYKLIACVTITVAAIALLYFMEEPLLGAFLQGESEDPTGAAQTMAYARAYLRVIRIGLIPYALAQAVSGTLRECGHATPPMVAGLLAVSLNLAGNYILIFGNLGAPALGVVGAAIATVVSRFAELFFIFFWSLRHVGECPYMKGLFQSLRIPGALAVKITFRGMPLMLNETLWSSGIILLAQSYSLRHLDVVGAYNISSTFFDLFAVVFSSAGVAFGILIGQLLGADRIEEAVDSARKMVVFSTLMGIVTGLLYLIAAAYIPLLYNTTPEVRLLATRFMQVDAAIMCFDAFNHASYFIIRSGGKTWLTMLFDSGFVWLLQLPAARYIANFTTIPILPFFWIIHLMLFIKSIAAACFLGSRAWANNIVAE